MGHPRQLAAIALALALSGGVSACSGDEPRAQPPTPTESTTPSSAATAPSPTPSSSASPSPSKKPETPPPSPRPTKPRAARANSQAGAVAFGLYFIDVVNYTVGSGELKLMENLSLNKCQACTSLLKQTREVYRTGGWARGGDLAVQSYSTVSANKRTWTMGLRAAAGRQRIKVSRTAAVKIRTGGRYHITMDIIRQGASWKVGRLAVREL
ncbi:MAG: DUF6318 family protein [Actinomycetota bacterium]|nr:DUF6318 family protein [Actinomycetota bacterium]